MGDPPGGCRCPSFSLITQQQNATHSSHALDAIAKERGHAYALVQAAAVSHYPLKPSALLWTATDMPKEASQSWRDDNFMQGTGEGYCASRQEQGTRIDKVLAEAQPCANLHPAIMMVNKEPTPYMISASYVTMQGASVTDDLVFKPTLQDVVNQPVHTLKKGDTVLCFRERMEQAEADSAGIKAYAIKLEISRDLNQGVAYMFLQSYKASFQEFVGSLMNARFEADRLAISVAKHRRRKADQTAQEWCTHQSEDKPTENLCDKKRDEPLALEIERAKKQARLNA